MFQAVHCRVVNSGPSVSSESTTTFGSASTPCDAQCCFRCFGNCKRIHNDFSDFRSHQLTCRTSLGVLGGAYGPLFCLSTASVSAAAAAAASGVEGVGDADAAGSSGGNPLCFCLYCGIGPRRNRGFTSTNTTPVINSNSKLSLFRSTSPVLG